MRQERWTEPGDQQHTTGQQDNVSAPYSLQKLLSVATVQVAREVQTKIYRDCRYTGWGY
jgi:hypothetical protein